MKSNVSNNNDKQVLQYQNYLQTSFFNPTKIVKFFQTLNFDTETKQTAETNLVGAKRIMKEAKEVFNTAGVISDEYRSSIGNLKELFKNGATTSSIKYASKEVDIAKNVINLFKSGLSDGSFISDYRNMGSLNITPFMEASAKHFVHNNENDLDDYMIGQKFIKTLENNWNNTVFTQDENKSFIKEITHTSYLTDDLRNSSLKREIEETKLSVAKSYILSESSENEVGTILNTGETEHINNAFFKNTNSFLEPEAGKQEQQSHNVTISEDRKNQLDNLLQDFKGGVNKIIKSLKILSGLEKPPSLEELVKQVEKRKTNVKKPNSIPKAPDSNGQNR